MNTKGFTLIELTAIIVVLATIFLVSFPILLNTARTDEEEKYENMLKNLCLAGESYIYANMDDFPGLSVESTQFEIEVSELIVYGIVDKDLINPQTNQTVEDDSLIYTVLADHSLNCKYKES